MSTKQELLKKIEGLKEKNAELEELVLSMCECDDATLTTVRELEEENARLLDQQVTLMSSGFTTEIACKELSNAVNWVVYAASQLGYRTDSTRTVVEEIPGAVAYLARRKFPAEQLVMFIMPIDEYAHRNS